MLIPYANRIGGATYNFNGTTFLLPKNDVAGLNNSLHGLLWNRKVSFYFSSYLFLSYIDASFKHKC